MLFVHSSFCVIFIWHVVVVFSAHSLLRCCDNFYDVNLTAEKFTSDVRVCEAHSSHLNILTVSYFMLYLYKCWHSIYSLSIFKHLNSQLWTTVKICLWQTSLSIFKLSVTRRGLSHHWQMSSWWSTPSERDEKTE